MQRKCECGSATSSRMEACHQSQGARVLRGKTSREIASMVKAEKYMSVSWVASSAVAGRSVRGMVCYVCETIFLLFELDLKNMNV